MKRPDLSSIEPEVRAYIEHLEAELARMQAKTGPKVQVSQSELESESLAPVEPNEPPTTIQIITATASGIAKRTARHLYARQHRGGMGVFDLETSENDPPLLLVAADESQTVLLLTNQGRAFRLPVTLFLDAPVHSKGTSIVAKLNLDEDEKLAVIIPIQAQGYLALLGQNGFIRLLRHHVFGEYMKPGAVIFDVRNNGHLCAACWTPGEGDLLIATSRGKAIRFPEKAVPPSGVQGIRLDANDKCVAITAVDDDSPVFLLSADGKGAIRLMNSFNANKAPGAGGKIALNTDQLISARTIEEKEDLFVISRLSKIIRFPADQVPSKEGVVQGVVCMALRADQPVAIVSSPNSGGLR